MPSASTWVTAVTCVVSASLGYWDVYCVRQEALRRAREENNHLRLATDSKRFDPYR